MSEPQPNLDQPGQTPNIPDPEAEDFAALFQESLQSVQRNAFAAGQLVQGKVVGIDEENIFIDIGAKSEAVLDRKEMLDEEGALKVSLGESLQTYIIEISDDGAIKLSHSLARRAQSRQVIAEAAKSGIPLEGRVEEAIKGGYRVALGEGTKAFCPLSQIDLSAAADPAVHIGLTYRFVITQIKDGDRDVVVSRRRLLEQERQVMANKTRETLQAGVRLRGTVRSIQTYGVFVDVGGVEGLLHVSEISHARVQNPGDYFKPGDEIDVVVKEFDPSKDKKGRLSLTRKPLESDPWSKVGTEFLAGGTYTGTVVRLADFGAFVELSPGLEGLVHISEISPGRKIKHPKEALNAGDAIAVRIQSLDAEKRRLSLTRVFGEDVEKLPPLAAGAVYNGVVDGHAQFGAFIVLPGGLGRGLMPKEESGLDRNADPAKEFPVGSTIEVQVLDIGQKDGKNRIRLSRKSLLEAKDRAEVESYHAKQKAAKPSESPEKNLGSLGELLKAKGFRLSNS